MALLYIVYHATSNDTLTIFETEEEAVGQIEKNMALDQQAKAKAKGKAKGKASAGAGATAGSQINEYADIVGAWSFRVVAMGTPFVRNANAADPDTRAIVGQQFMRSKFVQCEPLHPCHLQLIALCVGSSASEVADRIQPYRRKMAVQRLTRRADNALLDDLHICSFLYSITIYLCVAAADAYIVAQTSEQMGRSMMILREGSKFSLMRPAETTDEN